MNNKAKGLRMYKTRFANPHGLDHINNYSCCEDVYIMCRDAMNSNIFRKMSGLATTCCWKKLCKSSKKRVTDLFPSTLFILKCRDWDITLNF